VRQDYFAGHVASEYAGEFRRRSGDHDQPEDRHCPGSWYKTEFYGNAGYGLHSNDIRGRNHHRRSQRQSHAARSRAAIGALKGAEVGIRTTAISGSHQFARVFVLDFDSELLFVATPGTTEPSAHRRVGVEWTNTTSAAMDDVRSGFSPTPIARFTDFDPAGDRIPGAPAVVREPRRDVRQRHRLVRRLARALFGPRPLIEDDSVRSQKSLIFNARAGFKFDNGLRLQLDVLTFSRETNQIEYFYVSRLPGEPSTAWRTSCHPVEPLASALRGGSSDGDHVSFLAPVRHADGNLKMKALGTFSVSTVPCRSLDECALLGELCCKSLFASLNTIFRPVGISV